MNKSEQLIACLEGEIAKRDEELAECRAAVENCEVFRARIAELEAKYLELASFSSRVSVELPIDYAAPVSEAKAQGVVMPEDLFDGNSVYANLDAKARMRTSPENVSDVLDAAVRLIRARLNAAHVQQPKCKTCNDNGRIGGPSFYAPDEGGEPCPDCSAPVQQVSVPDGWRELLEKVLLTEKEARQISPSTVAYWNNAVMACCAALAAAPAAPAADAGLVEALCHISLCSNNSMSSKADCGKIARAAIAAHRAKGVV